jgi:AAA+ ATPase superfamily predicted ATPase
MREIGPKHPLSYRKDVLQRLFGCVKSTDSFFVIGGASSGKTRLMDHIMREEVQQYYLGDQFQTTWLIRVDLNRHHANEAWNFYELLISSMMLGCSQYENTSDVFEQLVDLDRQVLESRDFLRALRLFELAVHMLCKNHNINLCFLLDEFDDMYRSMPKEIFAQLRGVRDANKYQVCYGLFLRDLPERLRDTSENESFYELISPRMIGLGPYNYDDAIRVLQQMEERREFPLTENWRDAFVMASGGHAGLLQALLSTRINLAQENESMKDANWMVKQELITEECDKIWGSLAKEEQAKLAEAVRGNFEQIPPKVLKLLTAKGILQKKRQGYQVFSPIFERYLQEKI